MILLMGDARDWRLVFLHASSDLATFFGCVLIAIITVYVYRYGKFRESEVLYPGLWSTGALFVFFFGTSRALSFAEMVFGGLTWYVGVSKACTAICCLLFVIKLWIAKDDIARIGQILNIVERNRENVREEES